jgi:DNA-binding LacI/PurR family transcriptional regulator
MAPNDEDFPYETASRPGPDGSANEYIDDMARTPSTLPTIGDVARRAKVSTATVSRVLNQPDTVRPELQARVTQAVRALGYVPHAGARTMKLGQSGTVGAVFPTVDNAIFAKAIDALQRRLAELGMQLLIATSDYDPRAEEQQALNMLARGVDGLLLCGCGQSPLLIERLRQRGLPTVHVMSWPVPPDRMGVGFDNAKAMGQVIRYLLGLGHRRVAMLAGVTRDNDRAAERGARRARRARRCRHRAAGPSPGRTALRPGGSPRRSSRADEAPDTADGSRVRQRRAGLRRAAGGPATGHRGAAAAVDRRLRRP